jgi:hypothetical protein
MRTTLDRVEITTGEPAAIPRAVASVDDESWREGSREVQLAPVVDSVEITIDDSVRAALLRPDGRDAHRRRRPSALERA